MDVYRPQRGNSTKTFHLFTVYTTVPHSTKNKKKQKRKRKNRLKEWVHGCFIKINGERRYTYIALVEGEGVNLIL